MRYFVIAMREEIESKPRLPWYTGGLDHRWAGSFLRFVLKSKLYSCLLYPKPTVLGFLVL